MPTIASLTQRKVLNSHVAFTSEYELRLDDGRVGRAAAPEGETISIYEDNRTTDPDVVIARLRHDGMIGGAVDQEIFDGYLESRIPEFGRNTCHALSLALHEAVGGLPQGRSSGLLPPLRAPRLCCNILNGGWSAYTNPVLSDFPEYLLMAKSDDIEKVIGQHGEIQSDVRARLVNLPREVVGGNPVSRLDSRDNRVWIEFILDACDRLGFAGDFDLMIDASAGDLWDGQTYRLAVTDGSAYSREQFCDYWLDLIGQYPLRFLEDPFAEGDADSWARVASCQGECRLIGDNLYSSDAARIERGAARGWTQGVIVKPNQAGTVTAVRSAMESARRAGQVIIASHRSISTESTYVARLACELGAEYIKIGPLLTDYTSVMRLNEILRLTR